MSLKMNNKNKLLNISGLIVTLSIALGCASKPVVPTKDICKIKKHPRDSVFQVLINDRPINKRWYIHSEAMDIAKQLGSQNKCMI